VSYAPRLPLPDSPITSVSGPGITMLLVTPLPGQPRTCSHPIYDEFHFVDAELIEVIKKVCSEDLQGSQ